LTSILANSHHFTVVISSTTFVVISYHMLDLRSKARQQLLAY